ncbi:MAG: transcription-repair coupling factor [Christensenellales bacterium]|jgi:transcription-repair coupling factor (superfamily II helicase)
MQFETKPQKIILDAVKNADSFRELAEKIERGIWPIALFGLPPGSRAAVTCAMQGYAGVPENGKIVFAAHDSASALEVYDDISKLCERAVFLPAKEKIIFGARAQSKDVMFSRLSALHKIASGKADIVVCPTQALLTPAIPPEILLANSRTLRSGDIFEIDALCEYLAGAGYEPCDMVEGRGQFARRGGIVDIYPVGQLDAVRVEFFDDEIDTIRRLDASSQRSSENTGEVTIIPATETIITGINSSGALLAIRNEIDKAAQKSAQEPGLAAASFDTDDIDEASDDPGDLGDELPSLWEMKPLTVPKKRLPTLERHYESLESGQRFSEIELYLASVYGKTATLFDYLDAIFILDEPARAKERCEKAYDEFAAEHEAAQKSGDALPSFGALMRSWQFVAGESEKSEKRRFITMNELMAQSPGISPKALIKLDGASAPVYHGRFDLLCEDILHYKKSGYKIALLTGGSTRSQRLAESLKKNGVEAFPIQTQTELYPGQVALLPLNLSAGFTLSEQKLLALSENDIFGSSKRRSSTGKSHPGQRIKAFTDLHVGDFVVHDSHGVGVYEGMAKLEVEGKLRDYLHIRYNGTDMLYIPTDQMDRVQKYIGSQERAPALSKLGSGDWERQKNRVRKSVRKMAFDLVALYAQRQQNPGFAFSKDTPWQKEFEDGFPYEETPDQLRSIAEIKADMESPVCMDRLLCGDVGYGKTEVALRAAFKAVMDGKQVAFLAPTTLLAQQHYQTILERFKGFPVTVKALSRFRTPAEQRAIVKEVNKGGVDILVGTHRLLNKDLEYKNLGLLIIDEEQRFGVSHKEQIKNLKKSVDVLTLSATPIPRTLHMSMVGIRDMSTIETPPEERLPVMTYVSEYNSITVSDAIMREIGRGGQVYFVYNRVASIDRFAQHLRQIVPEAKIAIAHGQMNERLLEDVMADFMEKKFDVLLCSAIIESGLDIPSVNTMIIFDSDRFGLSQLYQLRGRVGRSSRLAYCHLTVRENKIITETAQKRLAAIKEFTQFGAGFKVAMRDLEIRGAGDIIGARQSGHMAAVGYDMYVKLIGEAVSSIKGEDISPQIETSVNLPVDAYLPDDYVHGHTVRMDIYKQIAQVSSGSERLEMMDELIDRFGDVPRPCENLIYVALVKNLCEKMGLEQVFRRREHIVMRYGKAAKVDPAKLVMALNASKKPLNLANSKPPSLLFKCSQDSEAAIKELASVLEALSAFL